MFRFTRERSTNIHFLGRALVRRIYCFDVPDAMHLKDGKGIDQCFFKEIFLFCGKPYLELLVVILLNSPRGGDSTTPNDGAPREPPWALIAWSYLQNRKRKKAFY